MEFKKKIHYKTGLIRGGINRTNFNETSEALFLNSGFVYKTAEEAEKAFKEKKRDSCILVSGIHLLNLFKINWLY